MTVLSYPTQTKAKREHTCDLCSQKIGIGAAYMKSSYKDDEIYTWKTHTYCHEISHKLNMYKDREGVGSDEFVNDIYEEYRNLSSHTACVKFNEALQYVLNHYNIQ